MKKIKGILTGLVMVLAISGIAYAAGVLLELSGTITVHTPASFALYSDIDCTDKILNVDFGNNLYPGAVETRVVYLRNEGDTTVNVMVLTTGVVGYIDYEVIPDPFANQPIIFTPGMVQAYKMTITIAENCPVGNYNLSVRWTDYNLYTYRIW